MSFILDALKKSEREREQQQAGLQPGIVYRRRNANQPMWMFAITGLLLLNFGFLLVVWLRGDHQQPAPVITVNSGPLAGAPGSAPPATTTIQANSNATSPLSGTFSAANASQSNGNNVRSLQDEASPPASEAADETAALLAHAEAPQGPQLVRSIAPGGATTNDAALNAAALANSNTAASNQNYFNRAGSDTVPSLDSIGGSGALNLPQLHLDIHVYSAASAERFVFINMRKYTEGQSLTEGPLVERITPDGAVLSYRGQRFAVPRQ